MEEGQDSSVLTSIVQREAGRTCRRSASVLENARKVAISGFRRILTSLTLNEVLMALAMETVTRAQVSGQFSDDSAYDIMGGVMMRCSKRSEFNEREKLLFRLLQSLGNLECLDPQSLSEGLVKVVHDKNKVVEFRRRITPGIQIWEITSGKVCSILFDKAVEDFKTDQYNAQLIGPDSTARLQDACLKLKLGAIHEIYKSLNIGWILLEREQEFGQLLGPNWMNNEASDRLDKLVNILSNPDNSEQESLGEEEDNFELFQKQLDFIDDVVEIFFMDVDEEMAIEEKRKYLVYSFPQTVSSMVDDLFRQRQSHQYLLETILETVPQLEKENEELAARVSTSIHALQDKDAKTWSLIELYHENVLTKEIPIREEKKEVYNLLLRLINDPCRLSQQYLREGQPMRDLQEMHGLPVSGNQPEPRVFAQEEDNQPEGEPTDAMDLD